MTHSSLLTRLQQLRLLILDVDGTLTNSSIGIDERATHIKHFCVKDGLAIRKLTQEDLAVGIISHSTRATAIQERASMLNIAHCYIGKEPKDEVLKTWCAELCISSQQVAVIGDDLNDTPLFEYCGHSACPSDAHPRIRQLAEVRLTAAGGEGCVREWIDDYFLVAKYWRTASIV